VETAQKLKLSVRKVAGLVRAGSILAEGAEPGAALEGSRLRGVRIRCLLDGVHQPQELREDPARRLAGRRRGLSIRPPAFTRRCFSSTPIAPATRATPPPEAPG
jgi:hypothetical protein